MKKRVITGVIGSAVFIGVLFLMNTLVFPAVLSVASVIAVYEIEKATGLKNKPIMVVTLAFSAVVPFLFNQRIELPILQFAIVYVIGVLILMLLRYENTRFEQTVIAIFASVCVPCAFSVMILFRDVYITFPSYTKADGVFLIIFSLFASWLTDACAYFVGSKLGKHKLCPKISPKKTVEGAIGGIIGALVFNLLLLFVFYKFVFKDESPVTYPAVAIMSVVLSIVSMFGDLSASAIKRNYGIKDFGNLLPGHGGIMDRFDSCLFVMPVLYAVISMVNN